MSCKPKSSVLVLVKHTLKDQIPTWVQQWYLRPFASVFGGFEGDPAVQGCLKLELQGGAASLLCYTTPMQDTWKCPKAEFYSLLPT